MRINMRILLFISLLAGQFTCTAQYKTADALVRAMYKKHAGKGCKSFTFSQDNRHYKNDTVAGTSVWHEAIEYPDKFRIDFGDPKEGNAVIFRNDSAYHFRKGKLTGKEPDKNDLLLLLGGMYYRTADDAIQRLKDLNFDLGKFSENKLNNSAVYVVGAMRGDSLVNQFWVEKRSLRVLRIISRLDESRIMDIRFENFVKNCGGYTETLVKAWINGKMAQEEKYKEINPGAAIPAGIFDPEQFGKTHWKK